MGAHLIDEYTHIHNHQPKCWYVEPKVLSLQPQNAYERSELVNDDHGVSHINHRSLMSMLPYRHNQVYTALQS